MTCTCYPVRLLASDTEPGGHDWNSQCLVHGYTSAWFSDGRGKAYFMARTEWDLTVSSLAAIAKETGISQAHLLPPLPQLDTGVSLVHQPTAGSTDELSPVDGHARP